MAAGATQRRQREFPPASRLTFGADGSSTCREAIHQAVQDNPASISISNHENTPQGLRIQLVDQTGGPCSEG